MSIKLEDLPLEYQRQVMAQVAGKPMRPKYGNKKTEVYGVKFDSRKEAERFTTLFIRLQAGEISGLRLQCDFTLQEAFTTAAGKRVQAIRYRADFTYWEGKRFVVEDVKSAATRQLRTYINKKKMMLDKYGIEIQEV